ncbi:MAG: chemotaxis protein CheC [Acidobacteria bacterium]|nr:chemotaxis protein CheC [Acidobacteriota bacterium]
MTTLSLATKDLERLRRISVEGAYAAERALHQFTGAAVRLDVAAVSSVDLADVPALLGGPEAPVVGIHLKVFGDCRASVFLALPPRTALKILAILFPPGALSVDEMSEMEISGLMEMGNILTCAYLNAMSAALGMSLIPSVPMFASDMAGAVVDVLLIEQGQRADAALVIHTEITAEPDLRGQLLLMPDPASLPRILEALAESREP